MATHDYSLANQSGASFRTDLNNALAAIQSNNSNSSSPATTVAYQWWADTSNAQLKIRNSANNAWITLFTLAGGVDVDAASSFNEDVTFHGASANIVFDKSDNALEFADGASATFGGSADLEIKHNNDNSFINDKGTGQLMIQASALRLRNYPEGHTQILCSDDVVELYYDNTKVAETLSTGFRVNNQFSVGESVINLEKSGAHHHRIVGNDTGNDLGFQQSSDTGANTNFTTYLRINDGGDISLPVDNQKLRFGAGVDLKIYSDGTNGILEGGGSGANAPLFLNANTIRLQTQTGGEKYIDCQENNAVELYFDHTERAATVSNGFTVKNKLFLARETGTTADYANFRIAFYQSIPADSSHTFQVGSVHAMGTVQIFGSRGATANNATLATGKIFPIHVRSGATAGLGTQIGSDIGGASGGFSYSVAAASQGITITNGSSSFAMNTFVSFDLTGFVG